MFIFTFIPVYSCNLYTPLTISRRCIDSTTAVISSSSQHTFRGRICFGPYYFPNYFHPEGSVPCMQSNDYIDAYLVFETSTSRYPYMELLNTEKL